MFSFFKKIYLKVIRFVKIINFRILVRIWRIVGPVVDYPYKKKINIDNFRYSLRSLRNAIIFGYLFFSFHDYAFWYGWEYILENYTRKAIGIIGAGGPVVSTEYEINIRHWYVLSVEELSTYFISLFIFWIVILFIGIFVPVVREYFTKQSIFFISLIVAVLSDLTDYFYLWFIDEVMVDMASNSWIMTIIVVIVGLWVFIIHMWISMYICDPEEDDEDRLEEILYFAWLLKRKKVEPWYRLFIRFTNTVSRGDAGMFDIITKRLLWQRRTPEQSALDPHVLYWTDENVYAWRTDNKSGHDPFEVLVDYLADGKQGTDNDEIESPDDILYQYFEHCARYPEEIVSSELWLYKQRRQNLKGPLFSWVRVFYYINKMRLPTQSALIVIGYIVGYIKMLYYWKIFFRKPKVVGPYSLYDPFTCKKRIWRWVRQPLTLFIPKIHFSFKGWYKNWVNDLSFHNDIYMAYCAKHYKLENWTTFIKPLKIKKVDISKKL